MEWTGLPFQAVVRRRCVPADISVPNIGRNDNIRVAGLA